MLWLVFTFSGCNQFIQERNSDAVQTLLPVQLVMVMQSCVSHWQIRDRLTAAKNSPSRFTSTSGTKRLHVASLNPQILKIFICCITCLQSSYENISANSLIRALSDAHSLDGGACIQLVSWVFVIFLTFFYLCSHTQLLLKPGTEKGKQFWTVNLCSFVVWNEL